MKKMMPHTEDVAVCYQDLQGLCGATLVVRRLRQRISVQVPVCCKLYTEDQGSMLSLAFWKRHKWLASSRERAETQEGRSLHAAMPPGSSESQSRFESMQLGEGVLFFGFFGSTHTAEGRGSYMVYPS